jgi:hypothetical protein
MVGYFVLHKPEIKMDFITAQHLALCHCELFFEEELLIPFGDTEELQGYPESIPVGEAVEIATDNLKEFN